MKREEQPVRVGIGRIFRLSAEDWPFLLAALMASFAIGATMPAYAYLFSEVYSLLFYRVLHQFADLGWVDLDLRCSTQLHSHSDEITFA